MQTLTTPPPQPVAGQTLANLNSQVPPLHVTPPGTHQPPTAPAEQSNNLDELLKTLGVNQDQLAKLIEAGAVIQPPKDLNSLPQDLKHQVSDKIAEAERITKDQLYHSINKQKEDIASLKKMIEDRENKLREEEQAKADAIREQELKKATLEQRMDMMMKDSAEAISKIGNAAETKIQELERQLYKEKLGAIRKDLISQADVKDFEEFIPNPTNTDVTQEQIQQYIEVAKQKKETMRSQIKAELESSLQKPGQKLTSFGNPTPVVNPGNANISSQPTIDLSKVSQMKGNDLKKLQDELLAKFGLVK